MKVVTNITVPSFVYQFYMKVANDLGNRTPEDVMADALFTYAGIVAQDVLKHNDPLAKKIVPLTHSSSDNLNP